MASKDPGGRSRFAKLGMAIFEELTQAYRDILEMEVPPGLVYNKVKSSSIYKNIRHEQELRLLNAKNDGYKDFDITLLYTLIRNICTKIPPPTKGWGGNTMPAVGEITIGDDIERIRLIRNDMFGHTSSASTSQTEFDKMWSFISDVCQRLQKYTKKNYVSGLNDIRRQPLEEKSGTDFVEKFEAVSKNNESLMKMSSLESHLQEKKSVYEKKGPSNEVPNENPLPEYEEGSILPQYIEELEASLRKTSITVPHSRGILIGCAEAGKTTLLKRLMGETQDAVEDIESTRGLEVHHHVFNIRNGLLEVSGNVRQQKAFIRFSISDLNTDLGKTSEISQADVHTANLKSKEDNSGFQILYEREQDYNVIENRNPPNKVPRGRDLVTTTNYVNSDAKTTTTIPRDILLKILDEKEKVPTISMLDLAGQFAYYACHQIYITKRVFFIFVLNVNQKFDDRVSTEKNNQEGSIFSTWTYKDYVKFWVTSIKTFGGMNAPVLIVATHAEEKSEDEIDAFFKEFWTSVPEEDRDWLGKALVDSEYDVSLLNLNDTGRETLEAIKKSIIKAATQKINNTIEVPPTWALLEQLVKEKGKEVMSYEEICDVNTKRLPLEFQLENQEMISEFLKFFHDNGLLLWFEEGNVDDNYSKGKVILDIQWFANAVNKLIADKNHIHKDCKRRYYTQWDSFNKTGKIDDKLVNALWQDESSYLDHKTEIMTYMEKLQMAVALNSKANNTIETGMSWYVACMNKKIFKNDFAKENWEYSSILCFRFSSFAMFVYYRVVAYCMSVLKWTVSIDEGSLSLYQTAAVFDYKNHTVIIGISENDIQVQVKRIKPTVIETNVSIEVGESVQSACKILIETFHDEIQFDKGYKCESIICNFGDRSFTPASELANVRKEIIQCECCSVSTKHVINVEETLRFWEQISAQCKDRQSNVLASPLESFNGAGRIQNGEKLRKRDDNCRPYIHGEIIYHTMQVGKSIGCIHFTGNNSCGTGFRVGSRYVITAFHVMEDILNPFWKHVHTFLSVKERTEIKWTKDTLPVAGCWNLSKLFSSLDPIRRDTLLKRGKELITDSCQIKMDFKEMTRGTFLKFSHDPVTFACKKNDVVILELAEQQVLPEPLILTNYSIPGTTLHVFGHPNKKELQHDSDCRIVDDETELSEIVEKGIKFFTEKGFDSQKVKEDYAPCKISPDHILFHCSKTIAHGASGSPLVVVTDKARVLGMLQTGHPKLYYNYSGNNHLDDHPELLVECGISMNKVKSLLDSHSLFQLSNDLFSKESCSQIAQNVGSLTLY